MITKMLGVDSFPDGGPYIWKVFWVGIHVDMSSPLVPFIQHIALGCDLNRFLGNMVCTCLFQVESALSHWALETMINALRMTSLHGIETWVAMLINSTNLFWIMFFENSLTFVLHWLLLCLGENWCGRSWISYLEMRMIQHQFPHLTQPLYRNIELCSMTMPIHQ